MAQWTNLQRIEKFENPARLFINCEKSGGLYLAEPGLTAGWLQIKIFDFPLCLAKVLHYFNNFDALQTLF